MLVTEGMVIDEALNSWFMTPITINPFILVMDADMTIEVRPETGEEMVMMGVV